MYHEGQINKRIYFIFCDHFVDSTSDYSRNYWAQYIIKLEEEYLIVSVKEQIKFIEKIENKVYINTASIFGQYYTLQMVYGNMMMLSYLGVTDRRGHLEYIETDRTYIFVKTENIRFDNTNTYFSCFAYDQDETFYCIYSIKTNDIYYCEYDSSNSKFKTEVVLTTMSNNSGIVVETVKNIRGTGMNGYGIALVTPGNLIYLFSFDVDEKTATHSIVLLLNETFVENSSK